MRGQGGYVLVNALILVAALAAAAVYLLGRSEATVARGLAALETAQLGAYLDAFDALALTVLDRDLAGGAADHPGEAWARATRAVLLDRGRVAGEIADLQGLFNLNWLGDPEDDLAATGFRQLSVSVGLAPQKADAILALLSPGGPDRRASWAALDPPLDPVGGAVLHLDPVWRMPELTAEDRARLAPFVTALPGDTALNINTAPAQVLRSLIPGATLAGARAVVEDRRVAPFVSMDEIEPRLSALLPQEAMVALDPSRFTIGSDWFGVRAAAELGPRQASRRSVIRRRGLPEGAVIRWRQTDWE